MSISQCCNDHPLPPGAKMVIRTPIAESAFKVSQNLRKKGRKGWVETIHGKYVVFVKTV